jgi:hypothetical protein
MGGEADELLKHRFAINNIWRPIASPLLCYPNRSGEIYAVTYNPNQRWYYFPRMQPDKAVLIRCFDSARSGPGGFRAGLPVRAPLSGRPQSTNIPL